MNSHCYRDSISLVEHKVHFQFNKIIWLVWKCAVNASCLCFQRTRCKLPTRFLLEQFHDSRAQETCMHARDDAKAETRKRQSEQERIGHIRHS